MANGNNEVGSAAGWYSPGWCYQGNQPDPFNTAGWTSQVLTSGAQVQKQGSSTGNLITETGTANPADYGLEAPAAPLIGTEDEWEAKQSEKVLASRPKNEEGQYLNKDGSVSKTQ
jgi:hypothetical protein